jgi:superfamily II DNA or RNA helicase
MQNTLIDNSTDSLRMISKIKECIETVQPTEIMIATGYWDLPGMALIYDELKSFLEKEGTILRLVIGKEPMVRLYQQSKPLKRDDFPGQYLKTDIDKLALTEEYQKVVQLILTYCSDDFENSKLQIKIYGQGQEEQFLHAKCYIFNGKEYKYGIVGSSNFTKKGLEDNAELNYFETTKSVINYQQDDYVKGHITWFNEKWEQSVPWNQVFLEEVLKPSPLGKKVIAEKENLENNAIELSPHDAYIKFLQNVWGDVLDSDWQKNPEKFFPVDPQFKLLQYQIDAVNQGFSIMRKHGGFILADVVGLGKTMVGIMVIKRYLLEYGVDSPVLIVAPPAIKGSWEETISYFDEERDFKIKNHVQFITTGSIGKLVDDEDDIDAEIEVDEFETTIDLNQNYGLVLVDESHKFRNSDTNMYRDLVSITERQPRPYVVLLSATPQNNRPNDLKNQIYLFQHEHANTTLETIPDKKLDTYFNSISLRYQDLISAKRNGEKKSEKELADDLKMLKYIAEDLRKNIVEPLVVRHTRTDIEKYFGDDMESQGLKFPKIKGPNEIIYKMDDKLSELFYDTIEIIASENIDNVNQSLGFYRYRAIEFLINEKDRALYEGGKGKRKVKVQDTSARLAKIMQILLVKRLESSFDAFRQSLRNLMQYCDNMIEMIDNNCIFICPDIDINAELSIKNRTKYTLDGCYMRIRQKIKTKPDKNKEFTCDALKDDYLEKLQADSQIIKDLLDRWERIKDDPKLETFMFEMNGQFFSKETNNPHSLHDQKLVIFTEAIDTVNILKSKLKNTNHKVLDITASNRDKMRETIKANFDANYNGTQRNDYDVLITTEVLAEGVNLHRSNVIVNYDTPWNSTRLMQRIGRVNRIGSKEDFVYVYNFFPSTQGDAQLELVKKALTKLQAFHTVFGEDSQVFSHEEEVVMHGMTKFVVDESETPTTKFIDYLKRFKADKPEEYARIFELLDGLCAAKKADNESILFHIKANEKDTGLYYQTDSEGVPKQLSPIEMAESLQCNEAEPSALPLPENWEIVRDRVYLTFDEYLKNSGLITSSHLSPQSKKALGILVGIIKNEKTLPEVVKQKLITARGLITQGNVTVAKHILELDKSLNASLFNDDKSTFIIEFVERHLKDIQLIAKANNIIEPYTVLSVAIKSTN